MLSSIFISALLAGPVVAGVIPRQNTVTVKHTVTSVIATSTVLASYAPTSKPAAYSYSPPSSSAAAEALKAFASKSGHNALATEFGLNPINGLPAAPPQKPSSSPVPKKLGSASPTTPLVFHTFTSSKGAPAPTATNSPKPTKSAAASSSSSAALPTAYSSLPQAPPSFPTIVITKKPASKTSTASSSKPTTPSKAPPPPPPPPAPTETKTEDDVIPSELAALFSSKPENPYPYPTPAPKKPKPSNYTYPYPPKQ